MQKVSDFESASYESVAAPPNLRRSASAARSSFFLLVDPRGIGKKVHLLKVILAGLFGADAPPAARAAPAASGASARPPHGRAGRWSWSGWAGSSGGWCGGTHCPPAAPSPRGRSCRRPAGGGPPNHRAPASWRRRSSGQGQIPGHRYAVAVAIVAAALLGAPLEQRNHRGPILCGQIPYCINAAAVQLFGRAGADPEQLPHRQQPRLFPPRTDRGVDLVRLLRKSRPSWQAGGWGDAHIDRKESRSRHTRRRIVRSRQRQTEQRLSPGHVQKRFVNAVLLHPGV